MIFAYLAVLNKNMYNWQPQSEELTKSIYLCMNDGRELKGKGKYCTDCDTIEKRTQMKKENDTIRIERTTKTGPVV